MLVIKRIAARATSTSFHDTRPAQANPAKIAASDRRSTSVSSRRPASDAKPYARAMPPSIPSSTWPSAGAKSYMVLGPVDGDVGDQQQHEEDALLHLVGNAREPPARDERRVGVERHLLETHTVVHRDVDREEHDRNHGAEEDAQRDDPQQGNRFLKRRAPVVAALVSQSDGPQVERGLDGVVHIDADGERIGKRQ